MTDQATTSRRFRFGVLGCGDIAWRNMLPAMERAGVEVAAVASRDPDKAAGFADRFGAEAVHGYDALVERTDLDAVYVALPTGLHHEWGRRALAAGKHVLAEKPLTVTLGEATDLVNLARSGGLWLADNFVFPHHSQHAAVRKLVADGRIGEPRAFSGAFGIPPRPADDIRYRPELGGGALLDLGVYPLRAARLLLDGGLEVLGSVLRIDGERGVDLGGSALLCSAYGVTVDLTFGLQSSYRSTYALWGSEGRISLPRAFTPPPTLQPVVRVERQGSVEELTLPADDQFANLVRSFVRSATDGADFTAAADALLTQAALVDRIRETSRRVTV